MSLDVLRLRRLSFGGKVLHARLAYSAMRGDACKPSQAELAKELFCSVSQIKRNLEELKRFGLLEWNRTGGTFRVFSPDGGNISDLAPAQIRPIR